MKQTARKFAKKFCAFDKKCVIKTDVHVCDVDDHVKCRGKYFIKTSEKYSNNSRKISFSVKKRLDEKIFCDCVIF